MEKLGSRLEKIEEIILKNVSNEIKMKTLEENEKELQKCVNIHLKIKKLAAQIAAFPQLCLRHDRLSSYEQWGMNLPDAILNEYAHGMQTLASGETLNGASRFASGEGRHGAFEYE